MNKKPKCIWTGTIDSRVIPVKLKTLNRISTPTEKTFYVLPEFEQELRDYIKRFVKHGRLFLILVCGLILILPVIALVAIIFSFPDSSILISVGIITTLFGVVILFFPFTTPETIHWLGLKRAIFTSHFTGIIIIILGIYISLSQSV